MLQEKGDKKERQTQRETEKGRQTERKTQAEKEIIENERDNNC